MVGRPSIGDYEILVAAQGDSCAVCHRDPEERQVARLGLKLVADSDPVTRQFRALLCSGCKELVFLLESDSDELVAAIEYLNAFNRSPELI